MRMVSTCMLLFSVVILAPGGAKADLLSHFTFDGLLDDAGPGGNHGIFAGGDPVYVEGHHGTAGGAIELDGIDDYVDLTYATGLPLYQHAAFSVTAWVRGEPQSDKRFFSESSTTNSAPLFNLGTDYTGQTGAFDLYIRGDNSEGAVNHHRSQGIPQDTVHKGILFDGTWHHIAYVDNNGQVSVYIDGVKDSTDFSYRRPPLTPNKTIVGAIVRASPCCFFKGAVDDLRLYTHALSEQEVRELLDPGTCPPEGDTHVALTIDKAPRDNLPGWYILRATATDDSLDGHLHFFWTAENGGSFSTLTPSDTGEAVASFVLSGGNWTVSAQADDDPVCPDQAPDGVQTLQIEVDDTPHLITHLALDGNLVDQGDAVNPAVFHGADTPSFTTGHDGTGNGAVLFDGVDDLVRITQLAGLPIYLTTTAYTVCMWVKGDPQADMRVFSEASTFSNTPLVSIGTHYLGETGQVSVYFRGDTTYRGTSDRVAFDGQWHHIAWVDDAGNAVLYIDGIRDASDFTYRRPAVTLNTTAIGGTQRAEASHYFSGAIDDVRIYNYALSKEEILSLLPEPPDCPRDGTPADTHCQGLAIEGPENGTEGTYTVTATATDDSGDTALLYTFVAQSIEGLRYQVGPQEESTASFVLSPGTWTIRAAVDDDLSCRDDGPDSVCVEQLQVLAEPPVQILNYPCNGDLTDASGNGNEGLLVGYEDPGTGIFERFETAPSFAQGVHCELGGALHLEGGREKLLVEVQPTAFLPLSTRQAFSVALWVKGLPQPDKQLFAESSSTNDNTLYTIGTDSTGASGAVDIFIRSDTGVTLVDHARSTGAAFDGTWHHIVWVDDSGACTLYLDGQVDPTEVTYLRGSVSADTTSLGGVLRKGRLPDQDPTCCFFEGELDQVQCFNYALSAEQVAELYGTGPGHCCPEDGDTHCNGMAIQGTGAPGDYQVVVTAFDESGDPIFYYFRADNGQGTVYEIGPQESHVAEFTLPAGTWTVEVSVDDDPECPDEAADSRCSEIVQVTEPQVLFRRGDANADGKVDIADAITCLGYLFGQPEDQGKVKVPQCFDAADANDDENVDIADAIRILEYLFGGQGELPPPGATCGEDPQGDTLGCESYEPCK